MTAFELIAAITGAVLGSQAITALVQGLISKKKTTAEANSLAMDNMLKWADAMRIDIESLKKEVYVLRSENQKLLVELTALKTELHARGLGVEVGAIVSR